jgi:hypothetical protein
MEALNIKKIILLVILIIINQNCMNTKNTNTKKVYNNSIIYELNTKQIDSLKTEDYIFTKKIDFFTLEPKEMFTPTNENNFFAYKREDTTIKIINFENGRISLKRNLKKHTPFFYKENILTYASDAGEIQYTTYYYSKDKIVTTEVTESKFEKSKKNKYLFRIYVNDKNTYKAFVYLNDYNFHLEKDIILDEKQLLNIDEIALSLFYNKDNVEFYSNNFETLKEDTFIWDINRDN